jgi:sulfatase maturation enzyme AslB (radical SAM superfamily)
MHGLRLLQKYKIEYNVLTCVAQLNVPGYDAVVAAISVAFGDLSREIASEINAAEGDGR